MSLRQSLNDEIEIKRNYSFWRHPLKWWKDRKKLKIMNFLLNYNWQHGMKEEFQKLQLDMMLYGTAVMKNGKRISPTEFSFPKKESGKEFHNLYEDITSSNTQ